MYYVCGKSGLIQLVGGFAYSAEYIFSVQICLKNVPLGNKFMKIAVSKCESFIEATMKILLSFLTLNFYLQCISSKKLSLCSEIDTSALLEKELCKNTTMYPGPMVIQPKIYITEILDFNEGDNSLTISIQLTMKWNDSGITDIGPEKQNSDWDWLEVDSTMYSDLQRPQAKFWFQRDNKVLKLYGQTSTYEYFWFLPPHYLEYAEFLVLKIGCFVTPTSYPFDSHQCQVFFHTPDKSISRLTFLQPILDKDGNANEDMPNIVTYHGLPFVIQVSSQSPFSLVMNGYNYSVTGITFSFQRQNLGALMSGYFLPTGLYSIISIVSFAIDKDQVAGRFGIIVTLFLITTNTYNSVEAPGDRGISYIEVWMMGTSIPISFALLEYGFILALEKFFGYTKDTKIYDTLAIILVLGFHATFQLYFWFTVSNYNQHED